jgi:hypothetical protein
MCESEGHHFLESWRKMENEKGEPRWEFYAKDKLHFNDDGIEVLREYFDGAIGMLADKKYRSE